MNASRLARLVQQRDRINAELESVVRAVYPVGKLVQFQHLSKQFLGHVEHRYIDCRVTQHGYGTDIFITNVKTGNVRRVDGSSPALCSCPQDVRGRKP